MQAKPPRRQAVQRAENKNLPSFAQSERPTARLRRFVKKGTFAKRIGRRLRRAGDTCGLLTNRQLLPSWIARYGVIPATPMPLRAEFGPVKKEDVAASIEILPRGTYIVPQHSGFFSLALCVDTHAIKPAILGSHSRARESWFSCSDSSIADNVAASIYEACWFPPTQSRNSS